MATRTIARMYDSYADATAAVRDLEAAGFLHDDISLVGNQARTEGSDQVTTETGTGAGTGATLGTIVGGGAGLLAGLGTLAIPGLGPIVAAGWLIAALTGAGVGAAAGGLLGALTGAGVSEDEAHVYAEGVRRGGTLVTVRAEETRASEADRILAGHRPVDIGSRGAEYRAGGWTRYEAATDDTLGNPPGTMASRAVDRAAGTNISGAYPNHQTGRSAPGGVPDDGRIIPDQPDGAPGNPPGTKLSRGIDQVAGTNISGAHPENETGGLRDPDGERLGRTTDRVLGTDPTPKR